MGIMHRDIKPQNVLMTSRQSDGIPKIADFGLSVLLGPNESADDTVGSPGYAAPQVYLSETYTKKADVWSLGVLLY